MLDYKSLGPRTFEDERAEGNVRSRVVAGGCGTVAVGNRRDRPRFPCLLLNRRFAYSSSVSFRTPSPLPVSISCPSPSYASRNVQRYYSPLRARARACEENALRLRYATNNSRLYRARRATSRQRCAYYSLFLPLSSFPR